MTKREEIEIIKNKIDIEEILAQLAEESAELAQAALKLRRVHSQKNPTPVTADEAVDHLLEEVSDVMSCLILCDVIKELPPSAFDIQSIHDMKMKRWVSRL